MIYKFNTDNPPGYGGKWFTLPNMLVKKTDKLDSTGMIWCVPVDKRVEGSWDGVWAWERELTPYARCPMV